MALFKRKPGTQATGKEFEETLIAEEPSAPEPDLGATLTDEPLPSEPIESIEGPPEASNVPWSPETETPTPAFPAELEPHLRHEVNRLILVERNFDRPTKLDIEGKITSAPRSALSEVAWHPKTKVGLRDIHREIDKLQVRPAKLAGKWLREFKTGKALLPRLERVPQNILAKKIVYETEGGFVVEVTYRDGTETRKKFFTVSSVDGRTKALSQIQSGRYAQAHVVDDETVSNLPRRAKGAKLAALPGKLNTFAITNRLDVLEVEGIGEKFARRLHELGIHTTDQLRLINATVIANNLGASATSVKKWQQMSELMLIAGIGKQSAELLVGTGITGIDALKKLTPRRLSDRVKAAHKGSRGVKASQARRWILAARRMKRSPQDFPVVQA